MVERHRQILAQLVDTRLRDIGVFNIEDAADAAAGTGVELDEFHVADTLVLQFLQNLDHVFDAVRREVLVAQHGGSFSAGGRPADAEQAGLRDRLDPLEVIHRVSQLRIDF